MDMPTAPSATRRSLVDVAVDAMRDRLDRGEWQVGERIIIAPALSTEDARARFTDVEEVKPYLRFASIPT